MATNILVSEDQKAQYRFFVEAIRSDLGRIITIRSLGPKFRCFDCLWDPINKKSAGIYSPQFPLPAGQVHRPFTGGICPICNGTGQYTTEATKQVTAGIRWLKADQKRYVLQGLEAENDVRIKVDLKYYNDLKNCRLVEIDGTTCEVTAMIKRGLGKLIYVTVFLKRSEYGPGKPTDVSKY